ncbi:gamma-glutamyltransferase [Cryptococcus depauperatus CBS 7841]|uniref:Glutathione hydrolase n=1 Tax=Cryptococcus depauperatus CBS 7841 TaxID=1295531 RepID=A0A1E3IDQ5_9TREE|nr:gamma-glutamyltransferase [Cryptococcus depauperatus CBS 7841]
MSFTSRSPHPITVVNGTETTPLLSPSSLEAGTLASTEEPPAPSWKIWKHSPFRRVQFADRDDYIPPSVQSNESYTEPDPMENGGEHWSGVGQQQDRMGRWLMYCLLVLLGMVIGAIFSRPWANNKELGNGPMVPPVWTLPPPTGLPRNQAYLINATTAAVAAEDATCSNLGLSILRDRNGSAVDAAITSTLCIGLLNAFSSGIGGGGFMVVRIPEHHTVTRKLLQDAGFEGELEDGRIVALDFRETSPAKSNKWMHGSKEKGRASAQIGGLAVAVPGELRGLEVAHKLYGTLPWKDVVMPVAQLAKGWFVSRELAKRLRLYGQFMLSSPTWSSVYAPRGSLLVEGDFIQRINYGKTLEIIADKGASAFYEGEIAESSIETIVKAGGIMSLEDLKAFKALSYPAIHSTFMSKQIYSTSAPSSGGVMLGLLNILETLQITENGGLRNPLNVHRFIEAIKFAFGARSWITDPAFAEDSRKINEIYTKEWANKVRGKISDNNTHSGDYYGLQYDTPIDHGTTHVSVVDQWGGAASVTSTVNLIWGSHVMDPRTGIIFNDEQDDFAIPGAPDAFGLWPSPWNYPAPGKKPLSSIAPSIILEYPSNSSASSLFAVIGGSGGSRIFSSIAQVLVNLLSGMNVSESIEAYRVHNQIVPDITTLEVGPESVDQNLIDDLKSRGQKIGEIDVNIGISEVQAIVRQHGMIFASSDSRKNGVAAGY